MKDDLQAKISSLTQTREKLVQLRTVLKNKVNNLLAANFIVLKREELSTETGLRKALSFHFDPITDTELFVVVEQIRSLNQSIEKLDKTIEDHGSKMDGFKNLKSIKGIGRNDDWHPYLLVNTDRAYFDLSGNKISVLSRDFSLCRDMAHVKREQNYWSRIHRKNEYADQRKIYRILLERYGQIDRDWHSIEVSETEFIAEYQKRNRR